MNYNLKIIGATPTLMLDLNSIVDDKEHRYYLRRRDEKEWAVKFFTATTDMRDCIGNITEICGENCRAKAIYRGKEVELSNILIKNPTIKNIGERIMITEHLNVNGTMELIATKKRILNGDLNFINIGWSDIIGSRYLRIDVYTGNSIALAGEPNFSHFNVFKE